MRTQVSAQAVDIGEIAIGEPAVAIVAVDTIGMPNTLLSSSFTCGWLSSKIVDVSWLDFLTCNEDIAMP